MGKAKRIAKEGDGKSGIYPGKAQHTNLESGK